MGLALTKSYYEVLGVAQNASPEEIKKAYRKLAMTAHPDRVEGNLKQLNPNISKTALEKEVEAAKARFQEIGLAYETLSDPSKKMMYDFSGHSSSAGSSHRPPPSYSPPPPREEYTYKREPSLEKRILDAICKDGIDNRREIEELLDQGAELKQEYVSYAAARAKTQTLQMFFKRGAKPVSTENLEKDSILIVLRSISPTETQKESTIQLLCENGAKLQPIYLVVAAQKGYKGIVDYFLMKGMDINQEEENPIQFVLQQHKEKKTEPERKTMIGHLVERGATIKPEHVSMAKQQGFADLAEYLGAMRSAQQSVNRQDFSDFTQKDAAPPNQQSDKTVPPKEWRSR